MNNNNMREVKDLNALYSAAEIACWLGMSKRGVLDLARKRKIPVMRLNNRVLRFHPRTFLDEVKIR
jgi:hypothetical protein